MVILPLPKHQTKPCEWAERICMEMKSWASGEGRCRNCLLHQRNPPLRGLEDTRGTSSLSDSGCGYKEREPLIQHVMYIHKQHISQTQWEMWMFLHISWMVISWTSLMSCKECDPKILFLITTENRSDKTPVLQSKKLLTFTNPS